MKKLLISLLIFVLLFSAFSVCTCAVTVDGMARGSEWNGAESFTLAKSASDTANGVKTASMLVKSEADSLFFYVNFSLSEQPEGNSLPGVVINIGTDSFKADLSNTDYDYNKNDYVFTYKAVENEGTAFVTVECSLLFKRGAASSKNFTLQFIDSDGVLSKDINCRYASSVTTTVTQPVTPRATVTPTGTSTTGRTTTKVTTTKVTTTKKQTTKKATTAKTTKAKTTKAATVKETSATAVLTEKATVKKTVTTSSVKRSTTEKSTKYKPTRKNYTSFNQNTTAVASQKLTEAETVLQTAAENADSEYEPTETVVLTMTVLAPDDPAEESNSVNKILIIVICVLVVLVASFAGTVGYKKNKENSSDNIDENKGEKK